MFNAAHKLMKRMMKHYNIAMSTELAIRIRQAHLHFPDEVLGKGIHTGGGEVGSAR
jgi:hypothetical protein